MVSLIDKVHFCGFPDCKFKTSNVVRSWLMKLYTSTSGHGSVRTTTVSGRIRQVTWKITWHEIATLWLWADGVFMKQTLRSTSTRCTWSWNRINVHILDARRCSELGWWHLTWTSNTLRNPERFECTVEGCEMTFPSMGNMTRHVKKVHEGERPYECTWEGCDKMFPSSTDRNKHIDSVHLGIKPFKCEHEGCTFAEISKKHAYRPWEHQGFCCTWMDVQMLHGNNTVHINETLCNRWMQYFLILLRCSGTCWCPSGSAFTLLSRAKLWTWNRDLP
jgi:uncharacterized C2H2 Zn-finger protein